jgi:hypothetical protein
MTTIYEVEHLHQPEGWLSPGYVEVGADGLIASVSGQRPQGKPVERLRGFGVPGLSNLHSHAFQRALAGRTEFVTAAREAEHWMRDHQPQPDYADILVMSQLHAFVATPVGKTLPRLDEVPAFGKLALGRLSPQLSLAVLDEAHQEIEEVRGLLA